MVSTRNHPSNFPPPHVGASPTKGSPSKQSRKSTDSPTPIATPPKSPKRALATMDAKWSHTPSNLTLLWLAISLPLVIWDTGYVLLRPHSMPGGKFHSPIWTPYALYGTIDHVYGWPAYNEHNGFTAAQGSLNVVETLGYLVYLGIAYQAGRETRVKGTGAPPPGIAGKLGFGRAIEGKPGAWAVVLGLTMAVMTLSKTVLYGLNEAFSGFKSIGHNDAATLITMWIIPNGAWLVGPSYMTYVFGKEIIDGLSIATGAPTKKTQ